MGGVWRVWRVWVEVVGHVSCLRFAPYIHTYIHIETSYIHPFCYCFPASCTHSFALPLHVLTHLLTHSLPNSLPNSHRDGTTTLGKVCIDTNLFFGFFWTLAISLLRVLNCHPSVSASRALRTHFVSGGMKYLGTGNPGSVLSASWQYMHACVRAYGPILVEQERETERETESPMRAPPPC